MQRRRRPTKLDGMRTSESDAARRWARLRAAAGSARPPRRDSTRAHVETQPLRACGPPPCGGTPTGCGSGSHRSRRWDRDPWLHQRCTRRGHHDADRNIHGDHGTRHSAPPRGHPADGSARARRRFGTSQPGRAPSRPRQLAARGEARVLPGRLRSRRGKARRRPVSGGDSGKSERGHVGFGAPRAGRELCHGPLVASPAPARAWPPGPRPGPRTRRRARAAVPRRRAG